jgi:dTDP-4-amino-4,6-dideoxygalactose transaminase
MGLCPNALKKFLEKEASLSHGVCINNTTGKKIKACIPMHTYGHPCKIDEIKEICKEYKIFLIEDAAESVGSLFKERHTGTIGRIGTLSFNGNKIITAGGGGCIITNDEILARKAKHLSTTAKVPHKWEFYHDQIGYNYRMPNINAALLLAQIENLETLILNKRNIANKYNVFFKNTDLTFFTEPEDCISNYWLNSIIFKNKKQRDLFLESSNSNNIMTRPIWNLMHSLPMFSDSQRDELKNSSWLQERLVNLPSSIIL